MHPDDERAVRRAGQRGLGVFPRRDDRAGVALELDAGWGEVSAVAITHEQLRPQVAFESADLLRQRRLAHVQTGRRGGEVALVGDGEEVAQIARVHFHNHWFYRDVLDDATGASGHWST